MQQSPMLAQTEEHGHHCVALFTALRLHNRMNASVRILPQVLGLCSVKHRYEGQSRTSPRYVPKSLHHCLTGNQIIRADPVNGHHCGPGVHLGESLQCMCNAFAPAIRRHRVLEWCSGHLQNFHQLLRHGAGHQPPDDVSCHNPPDATVCFSGVRSIFPIGWLLGRKVGFEPSTTSLQCGRIIADPLGHLTGVGGVRRSCRMAHLPLHASQT